MYDTMKLGKSCSFVPLAPRDRWVHYHTIFVNEKISWAILGRKITLKHQFRVFLCSRAIMGYIFKNRKFYLEKEMSLIYFVCEGYLSKSRYLAPSHACGAIYLGNPIVTTGISIWRGTPRTQNKWETFLFRDKFFYFWK